VTVEVLQVTVEVLEVTVEVLEVTIEVLQVTVEVLEVTVEVLQVTVVVLQVTVDVVQVFHEAQLLRTMSVEAGGLAIAALGNHTRISFSGWKSVTVSCIETRTRLTFLHKAQWLPISLKFSKKYLLPCIISFLRNFHNISRSFCHKKFHFWQMYH
jgi:hypothetical protein